jgi:hypothetical protein
MLGKTHLLLHMFVLFAETIHLRNIETGRRNNIVLVRSKYEVVVIRELNRAILGLLG